MCKKKNHFVMICTVKNFDSLSWGNIRKSRT